MEVMQGTFYIVKSCLKAKASPDLASFSAARAYALEPSLSVINYFA